MTKLEEYFEDISIKYGGKVPADWQIFIETEDGNEPVKVFALSDVEAIVDMIRQKGSIL